MTDRELVKKAFDIHEFSYVPYSRFPVGAALLGHRKGDEVTVTSPNGSTRTYTVLSIERS